MIASMVAFQAELIWRRAQTIMVGAATPSPSDVR